MILSCVLLVLYRICLRFYYWLDYEFWINIRGKSQRCWLSLRARMLCLLSDSNDVYNTTTTWSCFQKTRKVVIRLLEWWIFSWNPKYHLDAICVSILLTYASFLPSPPRNVQLWMGTSGSANEKTRALPYLKIIYLYKRTKTTNTFKNRRNIVYRENTKATAC